MTHSELHALSDAGAVVTIGNPGYVAVGRFAYIDLENKRLPADNTLLPATTEFNAGTALINGTLFNPAGGPVDGAAVEFHPLQDITLQGGLDMADDSVNRAMTGLDLTVDGGVVRNGTLSLQGTNTFNAVRLENATISHPPCYPCPPDQLLFQGGLTMVNGTIDWQRQGAVTIDGNLELINSQITGSDIQLSNTPQITGNGSIRGLLALQNDLVIDPEITLDFDLFNPDDHPVLRAAGHHVTTHGRIEVGRSSDQIPENRMKLEADVLTVFGTLNVQTSGADIDAQRLVLGPDSTSVLALDPDPDNVGDPRDYRAILLTGTAELDGDLQPFVFGIDDPANVGRRAILIEADAIAGTFATVAPPPDHFTRDSGLTYAILYTDTTVQVEFALIGDGNLNQQIEQGDLDLILQNWGSTSATWATGDMSGNGQVEQADLDMVLQNWGSAATPDFRGLDVPEPTTLVSLAGLAALVGLRRRRPTPRPTAFPRTAGTSALLAATLAMAVAPAGAVTTGAGWIGPANGDWDNPAHWSGGVVPDVWTSNGVAEAFFPADASADITQTHHMLDVLAGSPGNPGLLRTEHDLRIRNSLRDLQLTLANGANLILEETALLGGGVSITADASPTAIPRVRFESPSLSPVFRHAGLVAFAADPTPGGQPLVLKANGPGSANAVWRIGQDGSHNFSQQRATITGPVHLNLPTDVGTENNDASLSFALTRLGDQPTTINAPITVGVPLHQLDSPDQRRGYLNFGDVSPLFGPNASITLNPSAVVTFQNTADLATAPGLAVDLSQLQFSQGIEVNISGWVTRSKLFTLSNAGATTFLDSKISLEGQRIATDALLPANTYLSQQNALRLGNGTLYNPAGGPAAWSNSIGLVELQNFTLEGGLDMTHAPADFQKISAQNVTFDGGVLRNARINLSGPEPSRLRGVVHLDNTYISDLDSAYIFDSSLEPVPLIVEGTLTLDDASSIYVRNDIVFQEDFVIEQGRIRSRAIRFEKGFTFNDGRIGGYVWSPETGGSLTELTFASPPVFNAGELNGIATFDHPVAGNATQFSGNFTFRQGLSLDGGSVNNSVSDGEATFTAPQSAVTGTGQLASFISLQGDLETSPDIEVTLAALDADGHHLTTHGDLTFRRHYSTLSVIITADHISSLGTLQRGSAFHLDVQQFTFGPDNVVNL